MALGHNARPIPREIRMLKHSIPVAIVDAFTRTAGHGNRAGVVVEASGLDDGAMRTVARAVAASETAFVLPSDGGVKLRYFSPATEVDFCGHATVATFHLLVERGTLKAKGRYPLETAAGRLEVEIEPADGTSRVWIATPRHPWTESPIPIDDLLRLLGGRRDMLDARLPVQRSGPKLYVPLARRDDLWALAPRWDELVEAGQVHGVRGVLAFTREAAEPGHVVQSRFFAPAMGVREDPVTGSANGPLGEYLVLHGVLALPHEGGTVRARAEQGDAMGKPGRADLEVTGAPGRVESCRVGGVAVTVMDGTLFPR
jgi:PhzF family phenazine biosynthesis protein